MAAFASIRIEGGLLGPDILEQLATGDLPGQKPADFGLEPRRNLTDEIAATFADARALWGVFRNRLARLKDDDPATTVTRDAFVIPLLGLLGYAPVYNHKAWDVDGQTFAISHRADEDAESPPIHIVGARQELGRVPASGRPRMAPHTLLQEYLNRTEHLWGIVTNGFTLRILRDCTFVRRQAYVEFDLPAIFDEQRFQDFAALYRLVHRSRLPRTADTSESLIEGYHAHSVEQGGRVREHLRDGVEECIRLMANGFLRHPANADLLRRVSPDSADPDRLTPAELYRQLLILVYRFLFLLVSEDRGLLGADSVYHRHYGIARLRRLVDIRAAHTADEDLWLSLRVLWHVLSNDAPVPANANQPAASFLGLPVLNGDLFAPQFLDRCTIANADLLAAFRHLVWYEDDRSKVQRRVNYGALDVEELGSVYESLLELHPRLEIRPAQRPVFEFVRGGGRKETGSYYTPPQLVGELVRSALEPVIADRLKAPTDKRQQALLAIRVCDPACGSGHFLLAAARRLGRELSRVRTGEDEPAPERFREAVRDVIAQCIYGVDRNPLAVDLCRVALWLEGHTADKPLTFLDHHIRCGDSLIGVFDLDTLRQGIPDKAFEPLEGDDKPRARELVRLNRDERAGVQSLLDRLDAPASLTDLHRSRNQVDALADDTPHAVREKKRRFEDSRKEAAWLRLKTLCDLWTSAFFQPLRTGQPAITSKALADFSSGQPVDPRITGLALRLSTQHRFFHWPLEFPEVFDAGGFDVILSNPPWEHVELKEQEFFAVRDAAVATARTKAERTKEIRKLAETNPELFHEYLVALRAADASRQYLASSNRYPLTGRGRINTYAVFAELTTSSINKQGRCAIVLPKGIATDDTTKEFFGSIVSAGRLIDLIGFENEEFIFPAVDHRVTFCKMTVSGKGGEEHKSRIGFYVRRFAQLAEPDRFFTLSKDDFWLLNPNTGNCPIFRTQADAELTKAIYRRVPILWREATADQPEANPWRLKFMQGLFNMSSDSHHFRTADDLRADGYQLEGNIFVSPYDRYLPLYEAKMLHQFDHRFSTYEGATQSQLNVGILPQPTEEQKRDPAFVVQPRYWVREEIVDSAIPRYPEPLATALAIGHEPSLMRILITWLAGYHLQRGEAESAANRLLTAARFDLERSIARGLNVADPEQAARDLQEAFPLTEADAMTISNQAFEPEDLARDLVDRFSPRWLMGWRDITNAQNERTLLASFLPKAGVGNNFPLFFPKSFGAPLKFAFEAMANSFVVDFVARQKVGGTHINYFYIKQFPFKTPEALLGPASFDISMTWVEWTFHRVAELTCTTYELAPLSVGLGIHANPFIWNPDRRFEIRCELDAAMFHIYLPAENSGSWKQAADESPQQLDALKQHFPTPRDAVDFILEQFPIVREKDKQAHGTYRTKDRILEIYDAMLTAQRAGQPFRSSLNPQSGSYC